MYACIYRAKVKCEKDIMREGKGKAKTHTHTHLVHLVLQCVRHERRLCEH